MANVEEFCDKHISLKVEQASDGFWMGVTLLARIPLPPEEVYAILVSPENHKVFRSIKAFRNRQIIAVNKNGVEVVEVEQLGQWRFGPFRGQFSVKLHVEQDHHRRSIKFRLAPSKRASFMRKFNGEWEVKPFNGDSVEEMLLHTSNKHKNPFHGIGTALQRIEESIHGKPRASLVRLHQCVAPAAVPPPPLDQWLKKITAAQVRTVMEDLMKEADRINDAKKKKDEEVSKARNSAGFDLSAYIHQLGSGRGYC